MAQEPSQDCSGTRAYGTRTITRLFRNKSILHKNHHKTVQEQEHTAQEPSQDCSGTRAYSTRTITRLFRNKSIRAQEPSQDCSETRAYCTRTITRLFRNKSIRHKNHRKTVQEQEHTSILKGHKHDNKLSLTERNLYHRHLQEQRPLSAKLRRLPIGTRTYPTMETNKANSKT
jgi:hypothetical protein